MVLVGRATEQETLARLLASARLGRGGALVVSGEPGVGKSALLADALDGAGADGGVRVLGTTPAETEQDLAFAVLHALLRPALGLLDDIPAPQAAELGAALSLRHGSGRDRFAIGAATLSLLSRFAEDGPVVLVLDDVQWADRPSVDALAFAARRLRDDPVAVLVAGRSDELPDAVLALPRLHLAGLDPGATATLLAAAFPAGTARAPDALHRETEQGGELAMALAGLASLESRAGRGAACREHAADATVLCKERSMRFGVVWCELALGDLALSEGESGEAVDRLTALAATLDERGIGDPDLHPGPELVDALLRTGRPAPARDVAERFADAAAATGRPWTRARADRALALVVPDDDEADRLFASALAHHARTRDVFERARTQLAHGMRLRRSGRRVAARAALRDAWDTFDGLGAQLWGATARTELEATGERVVPRERHGPGALTPQQLQVCLLLADGRTTRETAAALFLSPKTVEYHLRKVYTRLGIHSRDELAAVLADAG